jgi:hypothetical protein
MNHTKEPWEVGIFKLPNGELNHAVFAANDIRAMALTGVVGAVDSDESMANASRIMACVNACAGIPTDDLERWGISLIEKIREDEANVLGRQRDELLAAAITVRDAFDSLPANHKARTAPLQINALRSAIANVSDDKTAGAKT